MNKLSVARLTANLILVFGGAALFAVYMTQGSMDADIVWWIGGLTILGGVLQFVVSVLFPRDIRPAWDEVTVASHRGSYQFGYWCALAGFWALLIMNRYVDLDAEVALVSLGVLMICAPSIWMVIATFNDRA